MTKLKFCRASGSLGYTAGNMLAVVLDMYKKRFPPNFLKSIYVNSELSFKEMKENIGKENKIIKKDRPLLVAEPSIDFSYESPFENTFFNERLYDTYEKINRSHTQKLFHDKTRNLLVDYIVNEYKMTIRLTTYVNTLIKAYDLLNVLKNTFRINHPYYLERNMESNMPREIMLRLSKDSGIPIDTPEFMKYLNQNSLTPITYKLKKSSGNNEYFNMYITNFEINIGRLDMSDGSKKGFDKSDFTVSHEIDVIFKTPALFYYLFDPETVSEIGSVNLDIVSENDILPIYTIQNIHIPEFDETGKRLETSFFYKSEEIRESRDSNNLVPPFERWNLDSDAIIKSPYSLSNEFTVSGGVQRSYVDIPIYQNIPCTIQVKSNTANYLKVELYDNSDIIMTEIIISDNISHTFKTDLNCKYARLIWCLSPSGELGTHVIENIMMNYGDKILQFEPDISINEDRFSINDLLEDYILEIIRYNNACSIDNNVFMNIVIYEDDRIMNYGEKYAVEFKDDTVDIVLYRADINSTYRVLVYFDFEYMNNILRKMKENQDNQTIYKN